jgi:protocatechuate 3,4-dioxygenase beta subunit
MRCLKNLGAIVLVSLLAACGGGGGSPGTLVSSGSSTGTGTGTAVVGTLTIDVLGGSGASATSISSSEIAQARAVLKNPQGAPIPGVVVTFSETGGSLLAFAPAARTALSDSSGVASVELRAAGANSVGATTVAANVTLAGSTLAAQKSISISSAPPTPGIDPQSLANALNFLDVSPADKSIVLAGSGGSGRSESATLRFRVVDTNNTPVKGVRVAFAAVPATDVTLNVPSATSDAEGVVVTTVSSKTVATAVVIRASVAGRNITSQSDQLLVTTGVATQAGFDLSASKYNLNSGLTGDSSVITVRIVDSNGNPVADGVPVVFTANFGAVGTSSRGGCSTVNGACQVTFSVQEPRPADGTPARVAASTRLGSSAEITGFLDFQLSQPGLLGLYAAATGGTAVTTINDLVTSKVCKTTVVLFAGTPGNFPPPAQTSVGVTAITSDLAASVKNGSPIPDILTFGRRAAIAIEIDATALTALPCVPAGTGTPANAQIIVKFTSGPSTQEVGLTFPYPRP